MFQSSKKSKLCKSWQYINNGAQDAQFGKVYQNVQKEDTKLEPCTIQVFLLHFDKAEPASLRNVNILLAIT